MSNLFVGKKNYSEIIWPLVSIKNNLFAKDKSSSSFFHAWHRYVQIYYQLASKKLLPIFASLTCSTGLSKKLPKTQTIEKFHFVATFSLESTW